MYKYEIIINWSKQDQVFIAKVPELLGCIAHSKTQEEAIINIKEAMELWIDKTKEFGDFIPQPKSLQVA
ncbi:type II toxin-antitoxin system HicB family antitoxin [Geminocystis sp. GBBB08]|uniref:type II toxin-antitoxin system HicB family antitoxin n=1 Tax=Geminocystis sp. GBBB08 TaxID=2604140 RepID=UPI0027E232B1|nr:type II toxin-antitoxin system HicB family antitoxin [Geminocystis sp. GBBB08]MBL1208668.1 type II toxin-antitoxin system HicB family antitoxin [Geminocystis sp. GBBB08]